MEKAMRMPTCREWDRLVEVTGGNDDVMHWDWMYSWCDGPGPGSSKYRACRGYDSALHLTGDLMSCRSIDLGFRPAIDLHGALGPDGSRVVMGTLYMDGKPVMVPQKPTRTGDIADYDPGAKLELREALDDPAYQMTGIQVDDVLIADRVMLGAISWMDILDATED